MKIHNTIFLLFCTFWLWSCSSEVSETITYQINEPILMPVEAFRGVAPSTQQPRSLNAQGKIAFYNGFMYISEPGKGIHILDNRDPKNPQNVGFIDILGNVDMAIKDNILYADSYIDLVWFDISKPSNPVFKGRKENVFPEAYPPTNNTLIVDYQKISEHNQSIVVGWEVRERTETYTRERSFWGWLERSNATDYVMMNGGRGGSGIGLTGSMARFAIYQNYLYTVLNNQMGIFNIQSEKPEKLGDIPVGWNVETIFSYKENMFMGTPMGMLIYSVSNPEKPNYQSSITHVYGCDPVVVENDTAYVTIHSGNSCGQDNNQLIIIDVKDVKKPRTIVSYSMTKPKGLAIDDGTLFVCDDGLKVFNVKNPKTMMAPENLYFHKQGMEGYDVIAFDKLLMMIADNGIYQYDYTSLKEVKLLSKIAVNKSN